MSAAPAAPAAPPPSSKPPAPPSPPARACSLLASEIDRIARRAPDLDAEVRAARAAIRGSYAPARYELRLWGIRSILLAEAAAWAAAVDPRSGATLRAYGGVSPETVAPLLVEARAVALAFGAVREDLDAGADPRPASLLRQACAVISAEAERIVERRVGIEEAGRLEASILRGSLRALALLARVAP